MRQKQPSHAMLTDFKSLLREIVKQKKFEMKSPPISVLAWFDRCLTKTMMTMVNNFTKILLWFNFCLLFIYVLLFSFSIVNFQLFSLLKELLSWSISVVWGVTVLQSKIKILKRIKEIFYYLFFELR